MKKFLLFAVVAILFAACTQDVAVEILSPNIADDAPETLTVGFEEDDTRIQLNENVKTVWTNGDQVSVFYRSDANQKWQYTGETGARIADLTRVDEGVATEAMKRVVVVYPYNENYYINTDTFNVQASMPAVQSYLQDSYGLNGNIMISQGEYNDVTLKNVCGWLKLQLTGNGEVVKSITLRGNNGEQVAGELYINSADATSVLASDMGNITEDEGENVTGGAGANLSFDDVALTEVTLDCGEGVTLGSEATAFYIALPPQTFEKGFTVDVNCKGYNPMNITTQKVVTIERNHIQPMAEVAFSSEVRTIANNEIWYTATEKIDSASWTFDTFGANIISHEWDATTGEGIITFDSDVTTIGFRAFASSHITEITIPDTVTLIDNNAFTLSLLKNITIPKSVKKIGYMAFGYSLLETITFEANSELKTIDSGVFNYCRHLTHITIPSSVQFIGDCAFGGCSSLEVISCHNDIYHSQLLCDSNDGSIEGVALTSEQDSYTSVIAYPAGCKIENLTVFFGFNTKIKWGAFAYCNNIKNLYIMSLKEIEQHNFLYCDALKYVDLTNTTILQNDVLSYCKSIKSLSLPVASEIGEDCFINNELLTSINLGCDELKILNKIGNNNPSLSTLWIPAGVITISDSFNSCAAITEVYCKATTPPALTNSFDTMVAPTIYVPAESVNSYKSADGWKEFASYIVGYDFETGEIVPGQPNTEIWYTATETVEPYNTSAFGANIISNEWDAETGKGVITFDGEVTVIGEDAFFSFTLTAEIMSGDSLTDISIPESVTAIGQNAFYGCNNLTSITIPNSVITIGEHAFRETYLKNITLGNGVQRIEHAAFMKCSFTSITFPESLTHIAHDMCFDCSSLETVYFKSATPPSIIKYNSFGEPFRWCDNLVAIYVPSSGYSAYRSTFPYELYYKFETY